MARGISCEVMPDSRKDCNAMGLSNKKRRELSSTPFPSSSADTNYFLLFLVGTLAIVCRMRPAIL